MCNCRGVGSIWRNQQVRCLWRERSSHSGWDVCSHVLMLFHTCCLLSGFLKAFSATFCTEPCSSSSHLLSLGGGSENGPNSQTGNGVIVSYMCRSLRKARVVMCFNDWNQSESVVWVHFASLQVQTLTDPMPEQVQQTCEKCGGKGYAPKMQSVREAIGQFWDTRPQHFLW